MQLLRSTGLHEATSLTATVHLLKLQSSLLLKTTGIMQLQIGLRRCRRRPYRVECTRSLSTSEVKQHRARLVLGWGTAWEHLRVLPAFAPLPHTHTHPHPQQPVGQRFEGAKSAAPCPHRRTRINSTSRTLRLKLAHSAVNAARPSMGPSGTMPASTLLSVFGARESQAGTIRRAK